MAPQTNISFAAPVLWIDDVAGNIGTVDVASGETHLIGPSGVVLTDIAFDPHGNLWGISFSSLFRINRDTGAATVVGSTGILLGNALVFANDGTLYAAGAGGRGLYTIDTVTGDGTRIGDVGFLSAGDLAFYGEHLYMTATNNQLIRISLESTISGVAVGPLGFSNVYGMARGDDNVLYGVAQSQIFSIDPTTGQGTLELNYAGHGLLSANGTAFINEAPEPATLSLVCIAAAVLRRRKDRHVLVRLSGFPVGAGGRT